jgi:hypothetical protein
VDGLNQFFTGYDEKDVYVCESRYSTRSRSFKKIKVHPENPTLKLVPREIPLEPKRVVSVFRERIEKHKDELAELQEQEKLVEKDKPVSFFLLPISCICYFNESPIEKIRILF